MQITSVICVTGIWTFCNTST